MSRIRQVAGVEPINSALERCEDVRLLMVRDDEHDPKLRSLLARARASGVPVKEATANVIARLSALEPAAPVLALIGRDPEADVDEMLAARGVIWLMCGVAYPGNVGMVVRTAEVSGAEGIVVDSDFDREARKAALRASMRADKFMPVHWQPAAGLLDRAAESGHRAIALDETAEKLHWQADLSGPRIFIVGGENGGIPPEVLARCDERVRVPMAGFIPCYNLQAAVSAIATERLRQSASPGSV